MKAIEIDRHVPQTVERPAPGAPADGEVLVRAAFVLPDPGLTAPGRIAGGGMVGTVEQIGSGVTGLVPGDAVTARPYWNCRNCFPCREGSGDACDRLQVFGVDRDGVCGELVSLPAASLLRVEQADRRYALGAVLAQALSAMRRSGMHWNRRVAISGRSPLAIALGVLAKHCGTLALRHIVESDADGKALAEHGFEAHRRLPAGEMKRFALEMTGGYGFDFLFETTGSGEMALALVDAAKRGSLMVVMEAPEEAPEFHIATAVRAQLSFLGSRLCAENDFERAVKMLGDGLYRSDFDKLLSSDHIVAL